MAIDLNQFIPRGLGQHPSGTLPIGGPWAMTMGQLADPHALYRMAAGKEMGASMDNMRMMQNMQGLQNMTPFLARGGAAQNMGLMAGAPQRMAPGLPAPRVHDTGTEQFAAGLAHEKALADAQAKLLEYMRNLQDMPWYQEWAPVIGSLLGSLAGPPGAAFGQMVGQGYQNYGRGGGY